MKISKLSLSLITAISSVISFSSCNSKTEDPPTPELTFTLKCVNPTRSSIDISIEPSDKNACYFYSIVEKDEFNTLGSDLALAENDMKAIDEAAEQKGISREEALNRILIKGDIVSKTIDKDLKLGTEYYLYAYGMELSGKQTSKIFKQEFQTEGITMSSCEFDITTSSTKTSIHIDVKPSEKDQYYYYKLLSEDKFSILGGTPEAVAESITQHQIEAWLGLGAKNIAEAVKSFTLQGDHGYTETGLSAGEKYHIVAFGVNLDGDVCTKVKYLTVSTEEFKMSDNKITLSADQASITWDSAEISVATTNNDPYIIIVKTTEEQAGKTDDQIIESVIDFYGEGIDSYLKKGNYTLKCEKTLMPETSYEALAFGYDGGATTALSRLEFKTQKASSAEDVTFSFSIAGKTNDLIHIEPSDQSALYIWNSISEADYENYYGSKPEKLKDHITAYVEAYIPDVYPDFASYVKDEGVRGTIEEDHWIWEGDGKYLFFAICMNPDGTFAGEPQVSEVFNF